MRKNDLKKLASRYIKLVEWSEEDRVYVGRCPELFLGGVHGGDEQKVYADLCVAVEGALESKLRHGDILPEPVKAAHYSGKFMIRIDPELHKALVVRAYARGESLNKLCTVALSGATG